MASGSPDPIPPTLVSNLSTEVLEDPLLDLFTREQLIYAYKLARAQLVANGKNPDDPRHRQSLHTTYLYLLSANPISKTPPTSIP
jgi:hypothetical protein